MFSEETKEYKGNITFRSHIDGEPVVTFLYGHEGNPDLVQVLVAGVKVSVLNNSELLGMLSQHMGRFK